MAVRTAILLVYMTALTLGDILQLSNERLFPNQLKMKHRFVFADSGRGNKIHLQCTSPLDIFPLVDVMFLYTKPPAQLFMALTTSPLAFNATVANVTAVVRISLPSQA